MSTIPPGSPAQNYGQQPVAPARRRSARSAIILAALVIVALIVGASGLGAYLQWGVSHGRWSSFDHPCQLLSASTVRGLGMEPAPREQQAGYNASCRWIVSGDSFTGGSSKDLVMNLSAFPPFFIRSAEDNAKSTFDSLVAHSSLYQTTTPGLGDEALARHDESGDGFLVRTGNVVWSLNGFNKPDPGPMLGAARELDRNLRR